MYVIIMGCGRVGSELGRLLADAGHNVVLIDKDANAFQRLGADFNGMTMTGNGFDADLLKSAGIEQANAFCAVTDNDNANIMATQVAKKIFKISRVIARINDARYTQVCKELGIDAVNTTALLAAVVRNKIVESLVSSFILESGDIDTLEIEASAGIAGQTVEQLNLPGESMIVAVINKHKEVFLPQLKDKVEPGDTLIVAVRTECLAKAKKALGVT